ncbi:MAG: endonuclease/exonuclease/phosphatase [Planctomycetota bacterium]
MQRILSLATLVVLGGLAWVFLRDNPPGSPGERPPANQRPTFGGALGDLWSQSGGGSAPPSPGDATPSFAGGPTLRIATYHIQSFGEQKASQPHVMHTLAEIVRRFDVVAIQGIRTRDDYHMGNFIRLVNQGGRRYDTLVGRRVGNTTETEQYAFVFDEERVKLDFGTYYTLRDPENLLHREPLVATFRARGVPDNQAFTFTLVNVHADAQAVGDELDVLAEVYRVVRRAGGNEDDVIMLGAFQADDKHLGRLGQIPGVAPLVSGVAANTHKNKLLTNLVIHQPSTTEYVGRSGVFDVMREFNLTLDQALMVSDQLPVWAQFSAYERDYAGRIATRQGVVVR